MKTVICKITKTCHKQKYLCLFALLKRYSDMYYSLLFSS